MVCGLANLIPRWLARFLMQTGQVVQMIEDPLVVLLYILDLTDFMECEETGYSFPV
jgi:hypothetical protein